MKNYNCDFHIHIGSSFGKAVKITASKKLTIENIIDHAINSKGMDIVGLVDCGSPAVLQELSQLVEVGVLHELEQGGLSFDNKLTIILGSEVETQEGVHVVSYFPDLSNMIAFSEFLATKVTNSRLSTQRAKLTSTQLLDFVLEHNGIFMPAHIFTPHKSYYGKAFNRLHECFENRISDIFAVELGLSSDSHMADSIKELHNFTFLTNSDAHSVEKIAREFNILKLENPTFEEFKKAIKNQEGRKIVANYGLDPKLGKYYFNFCSSCDELLEKDATVCKCGSRKMVRGVYNRILELADLKAEIHPEHRPQYYYQIPLEFIPKLGKKGREKAIKMFGSEINILHKVEEKELEKCLDSQIVDTIIKGRKGSLSLKKGGGGLYGKVLL